MTNVIFFGSSKHSLPVLKALHNNPNYKIIVAVSQPDRPRGRGKKLSQTEVKTFAEEHHIDVLTPSSLKDNKDFLKRMKMLAPDILVVAYYGLLIPKEVLSTAKYGGLNLHPSLLPKHRGSSPAQWAILEGEKVSGITIIKMSPKFDEGEIVSQHEITLETWETPESFYDKAFRVGAKELIKILPDYISGKLKLTKQGLSTTEYARRLTREDGRIDWKKSDIEIERMIRAFYPWPGTWTTLGELVKRCKGAKIQKGKEKRVKILKAHLDKNQNLVIDKLQVEGKNQISFEEFEKGYL